MKTTGLAVGVLCLGLLVPCAVGQTTKPQYDEKGPSNDGRAALPTKRLYDGAMQKRLFPSGFKKISIPSAHSPGMMGHGNGKLPSGPRMVFVREPLVPSLPRPDQALIERSTLTDEVRRTEWKEHLDRQDLRRATFERDRERQRVIALLQERGIAADALINVPTRDDRCHCPPPECCTPAPRAPDRTLIQGDTRFPLNKDTPRASGSQARRPVMASEDTLKVAQLATDTSTAEAALNDHLRANPDDFRAMRHLGVAQLQLRHGADAARTMGTAYASDPLLAGEPIDFAAMGFDAPAVRKLADIAQNTAVKANTPESWLLLLVIRQSQGQTAQALAACEKAEKAGLDASLVSVFRHTLSK